MARKKFAVEVTGPAERDIRNLDRQVVKKRIDPILLALEDDPTPHNSKALTDPLKGYHRVRSGSYRVIYWIDYARSRIFITKVSGRKDAY